MQILVTGGAGFIGSNYVRRILDGTLSGISELTILDKLTYAGSLSNLSELSSDSYRCIQGDICDLDLTSKLAESHDAIINFAAESHVDRSIQSSRDFIMTNILGTQTLLDAARLGAVQTFIQVSTDEVYGSIPIGSWTESQPLLANSPYAASKASADLIARSFFRTYGLDVRITRCSNNYGPNQNPEKLIPHFITNLIDGLPVPVYGDGSNIRDWLHVDDHCRGLYKVLINGKSGDTYDGFCVRNAEVWESLSIIRQALDKMPAGNEFHADVPAYYLPPKEDVYHDMESLIYHFKIVMGEVPVPVAEIYHAVEGGNGELGFYLVTDGSRTPYRLHFRRPCFIYYQAYPEMIVGALLSDAIVILSSLNVIAGELDA